MHKRLAQFTSALIVGLAAGPALADAISVNFDTTGPAVGQLPGGADARTAGNGNQWYVPDNAPSFGEVRGGVGLNGSTGLVVGNRASNDFDGVTDNVKSGRLAQTAGQASTGAANSLFTSSFWFRTASMDAVANFAFKTETWGGADERTSWLGFFDNGSGGLEVEALGYGAGGAEVSQVSAVALTYGAWYRVVTNISFIDGSANDSVTQSIYDASNALVMSFQNTTWEGYYEAVSRPIFAVDAIGFQARFSPDGDSVYIDDVSWSSGNLEVPEPGSLALVLAAGVLGFAMPRRRR